MLVIFLFVVRYPVTPGIAYDQSLVSYEERGIKLRFNSSTPRQPLTEYQQDGYIGFFGSIRRFQIFPVKSALGCGYEHLPERCAWVECEVEYRFKVAGLHFYRQPPLESPVSEADARRCRSLSYADVQTSGERHRIERWP
ncbi:hypothetical protein DNK34_10335 [Pseudomonas dryadis]|uniref:Uncharacterized protein n=2 Tax=Pseudomonadales TaxID=72274 RepID=A0ABY1Z6X3_9GAMM|nr:hypothetical protein DNK34_10335 [Pseudomonas dryadis]TBV18558.1 hypothetical protein DNK41_07635 [Pseudomonas sp. FRB 230]